MPQIFHCVSLATTVPISFIQDGHLLSMWTFFHLKPHKYEVVLGLELQFSLWFVCCACSQHPHTLFSRVHWLQLIHSPFSLVELSHAFFRLIFVRIPFPMASYPNPLHPPCVQSGFPCGLTSAVNAYKARPFLSPYRRRVPQSAFAYLPKWKAAVDHCNAPHRSIVFDSAGYPGQGFFISDFHCRRAASLDGRDDVVLQRFGTHRFTLRILVSARAVACIL